MAQTRIVKINPGTRCGNLSTRESAVELERVPTQGSQFVGLPVGTKIYYVGDVCNSPSFGEITAVTSSPWSPCQYNMLMVGGEVVKGILPSNFGGLERGGHRFRLQVEGDDARRRSEEEHYATMAAAGKDEAL
jgi:hypothetical protein